MTAREIVGIIARERRVEQIVLRISGSDTLTANLQDLVQMLYLTLLEYDEDKLVTLYEEGSLRFFLVRIIKNQWHSNTSPFHYTYRKFQHQSQELTDYEDKGTE
jgi:DNA-directed RNA polymerase specialized sigma24 family protein